VLTLEYEVSLARAWIHGPQVDPPDREGLAHRLYQTAVAALPPGITMHELYFDSRNAAGEVFALSHGFSLYKDVGILVFPRDAAGSLPPVEPLTPLRPEDQAAVIRLHEALFPNTYCPGPELVLKPGEQDQVFTAHHDGRFAGYLHVRRDIPGRLAHIEFLGVEEAVRGLGLGRRLLLGALRWGFEHPEVASVSLVVEDANERAYGIYLRAGFHLERRTRAFRRTLG
jgi:ribosomal protein S18 acetylase RimI-like enzyme